MKKFIALVTAMVMVLSIAACGSNSNGNNSSNGDTLAVPQVKDGVMRMGEDCVETYFEWDPVSGADGYEVTVQNKFYEEETYREPAETYEVTDPNYVAGAQDLFDFQIKVRAFKGNGDSRVYSDWSNEAVGSTYDESEITN